MIPSSFYLGLSAILFCIGVQMVVTGTTDVLRPLLAGH